MKAQQLRRRKCPLSQGAKTVFEGGDAIGQGKQRDDITRGKQNGLPLRRHVHLNRSMRSVPGSTSKGGSPRRKIRAVCGPFNTAEPPLCRTKEPSRRPTTGVVFSSRN